MAEKCFEKKLRMSPCVGRCSQSLGPGGWPGGWENGWAETLGLSVNKQLVSQVMENVVGRSGQAAGVGKEEVGSDQKVREVVGGDFSSDRLVVASGASVFENSLIIAGVNPHSFERSRAEGGAGCSEVGEVESHFCG
jgi:hypothetical protein